MFAKFIRSTRHEQENQVGTGTFCDGIFHLAASSQSEFDKSSSLRHSYGRDTVVAQKLEQAQPVYG